MGHTPAYCQKRTDANRQQALQCGIVISRVKVKTTLAVEKRSVSNTFSQLADSDSDEEGNLESGSVLDNINGFPGPPQLKRQTCWQSGRTGSQLQASGKIGSHTQSHDGKNVSFAQESSSQSKSTSMAQDVHDALFHRGHAVHKVVGPRLIFKKHDGAVKQSNSVYGSSTYDASGCECDCVVPKIASVWSNVASVGFNTILTHRLVAVQCIQRWARSVNGGMVIGRWKCRRIFNGCLTEMAEKNPQWQANIASSMLCQMLGIGDEVVICASCKAKINCPDKHDHLWDGDWLKQPTNRFCEECDSDASSVASSTDSWREERGVIYSSWADECESDGDDFDMTLTG